MKPVGTPSDKDVFARVLEMGHPLMTANEVASLLRVSKGHVYNLLERGELEGFDFLGPIRITATSLIRLLLKHANFQPAHRRELERIATTGRMPRRYKKKGGRS